MTSSAPEGVVGSETTDVRFRSALDHLLAGRTRAAMHYQPIVDLRQGTIAGYEALVRFPAPPALPPDSWFRGARLRGKHIALEHMAAMLAIEARELLPANTFLSVNVGPLYLLSPEFLTLLDAAEHLDRLVIEITEGDHIDDYPAVRQRLDRVRHLGGSVAVDDTGSGYASLKHVMELRPHFVKLDRFFIEGCHDDPAKAEMIHMIGEAADRLDAWLIAEGIETPGELNEVLRRGVSLGQGYLLGRPLPEMATTVSDESKRVIQFRKRGVESEGLWNLLESAELFQSLAAAKQAVEEFRRSFSAVVLDAHDRPEVLVDYHPTLGVRALLPPMRVAVNTSVQDVLRRAISRPLATRFDPVAVTGECGEFVGVLRIDHLMNGILAQVSAPHKS